MVRPFNVTSFVGKAATGRHGRQLTTGSWKIFQPKADPPEEETTNLH